MCDGAARAAVSLLEDMAVGYERGCRATCPDPACGCVPANKGSYHADGCKFAAYLRFRPLPRPARPPRARTVQFFLDGGSLTLRPGLDRAPGRGRFSGPRPAGGMMVVWLGDGRRISVPLRWFPRLARGTAAELAKWELNARGSGIHWPLLDEDISVEGLLAGRRSGECRASVGRWRKWLAAGRAARRRKG